MAPGCAGAPSSIRSWPVIVAASGTEFDVEPTGQGRAVERFLDAE
jgi:hypothetical protein